MSRQYITTAIDYANASPHMGHVMEKILADVCARWFRLRGDEVRFQIGMDEHGIKIQETAAKQGLTPAALVEKMAPVYRDLYGRLGISEDVFVRTTDRDAHWPTVIELWKRLETSGALEKRSYAGLYCVGCERFYTAKDLVDGKCPLHLTVPQEVKEENWFFLLGRETAWLQEALAKEYRIIPEQRAHETFSLLDRGLEDVSFSRPRSSLEWGIPVPGDEGQTMYVWCDALTNYISGIGLLTDHAQPEWWDDATVTHVIGKDIARFHALIWPAMLKHAGVTLPDRLLIHGFLTSEGQKMSKSIGNVVSPEEVLAHVDGNADVLRFYLSHEIPVGNDGDFSWKRFDELYDAKLRNQLGNLLNRVLVLLRKGTEGELAIGPHALSPDVERQWTSYRTAMDAFELQDALQAAWSLCVSGNVFIDTHKLWTKKGEEKTKELSALAELLRHVSLMLLPFIPRTAQRMARQLHLPYADRMLAKDFVITDEMKAWGGVADWKRVGEPEILFPPLGK
ncbi:MAG: methionine--tRNA ligase [Candidatus Peribacteraceae bacterium]|nr:methionine--tRNA ligase [Candidatus Peribacteraceae bacterium]